MDDQTCESVFVTCEYFALCTNETDRGYRHPILGVVPTCVRCRNFIADNGGLDLSLIVKLVEK